MIGCLQKFDAQGIKPRVGLNTEPEPPEETKFAAMGIKCGRVITNPDPRAVVAPGSKEKPPPENGCRFLFERTFVSVSYSSPQALRIVILYPEHNFTFDIDPERMSARASPSVSTVPDFDQLVRTADSAVAACLRGTSNTSTAEQRPEVPPPLSTGIELCFRNGRSNEQYRAKLTELGAVPVPKEQRKLSMDPNSKEEWRLDINQTPYLTAFEYPNTLCGIVGPGNGEAIVAALKRPSMNFKYLRHGNGYSEEIYAGQFEGEAVSVHVSNFDRDVYLVFSIDKMWTR
jgi:hypothetical protein